MSMLRAHRAGQPCSQEDMPGKWEFKEETLKNSSLQVNPFKDWNVHMYDNYHFVTFRFKPEVQTIARIS